jgi:hypothetical protein
METTACLPLHNWILVFGKRTAGKDLYPNLLVPVESEGRKGRRGRTETLIHFLCYK